MPNYRFYLLNQNGRIVRRIEITCADDADAAAEAKRYLANHSGYSGIEVWDRERLVSLQAHEA